MLLIVGGKIIKQIDGGKLYVKDGNIYKRWSC